MEHAKFSQPVEVNGLAIADADQAASFLLEYWPVAEGEYYEQAKLACVEAIAGKRDPDDARAAFVFAADEAGVVISV
ncbi:DUF982 domain-containing protein [Labrys sp. KNU-23]|uniref:DUF982 domain-containing protein n=1 Tax=Labrys sp. KNU-23 TaxID=2789216 RepID=UPI0011EDB229|nr:DUF982 domain-containing protein [Labrys sp. KNU-23]QEN84830.1 DUF982 domain-containing protein [Labrys sp. KNU-23]